MTIIDYIKLPTRNQSQSFKMKLSVVCFTGMAQRKRAGLITPRSLDRNELPVFTPSWVGSFSHFTEMARHSYATINTATYLTGMAQRKRAGLITLRSLDRDELPVFTPHWGHLAILQKWLVIAM